MTEVPKYTISETHLKFAQWSNGRVWELLDKPSRSPVEVEEMVESAYASLYHWRAVGTAVHLQRGKWLLAHVFTILKDEKLALQHANECLKITDANKSAMKDFDIAYAYEGMARALALNNQADEARKFYTLAIQAGEAIADDEDKKIFTGDFAGGEWHGIN